MKVVVASTSDVKGGAARAAYRLHKGLQSINVESQMLVQDRSISDPSISGFSTTLVSNFAKSRVAFDTFPVKLYRQNKKAVFSPQWLPDNILSRTSRLSPDIINLHWVNAGYVQIETIAKFKQPVVWTLHDMWAFTGGCHYTQGCERYTQSCGNCPQLRSQREHDLSRWIWNRKKKAWKHSNITVVALSSWLKTCIQSSPLLGEKRVELIPNGIDTQRFKPLNKRFARELLGLPTDKKIILFGAMNATSDKRKGFHYLQSALEELSSSEMGNELELAVFGAAYSNQAPKFELPTHYLGNFSDDLSLALVYSAADVFALPSVQDNLPNTIMEAIACGVPCVAFKIGGAPDMVEHQKNGYLATPFDTQDLANGIIWTLDESRHQNLAEYSRQKAELEFDQAIQACRYKALFSEILQ